MCFGWIDSIVKKVDTGITIQILSPRKKGSIYQRVRIDTIQIKKKNPQLFQKRLGKLIKNTKKGIMYGEWNDNGRLLNY